MKRFLIMAVLAVSMLSCLNTSNAVPFFDNFDTFNAARWSDYGYGSVSGGMWTGANLMSNDVMWTQGELVQAAVRFEQHAHASWSVPMALDTGINVLPGVEWLQWGTPDYLNPRGYDGTTWYQTYVTPTNWDATQWHVYAILPTATGANMYVKVGNTPFDPLNLPAADLVVVGSFANLKYVTWVANEYGYGNNAQVDWVQAGVPEPATMSLLILGSLAFLRRNRK